MKRRQHNGVRFKLAHGPATLEVSVFTDWTARWIFKHRFLRREAGDRGAVQMVNDSTLVVDYGDEGAIAKVELSMHIILPHRLGQVRLAGVDVSPGAKTFLTFEYRLEPKARCPSAPTFVLSAITRGASHRLELDEPALLTPLHFPFPVPERIEPVCGKYRVPFLVFEPDLVFEEPGTEHVEHLEFPASIARAL